MRETRNASARVYPYVIRDQKETVRSRTLLFRFLIHYRNRNRRRTKVARARRGSKESLAISDNNSMPSELFALVHGTRHPERRALSLSFSPDFVFRGGLRNAIRVSIFPSTRNAIRVLAPAEQRHQPRGHRNGRSSPSHPRGALITEGFRSTPFANGSQ